jgi:hypothetical protein
MVQLSFLLESSFIALTSIFVGTGARPRRRLQRDERFEAHSELGQPALRPALGNARHHLLAVYLVALLTTFIPALGASRIYPAEAFRYQ